MELIVFLSILALPAALILKFRDKKKQDKKYRSFFYGIEDFFAPRLFGLGRKKIVEKEKEEIDYPFFIKILILKAFTDSMRVLTRYYPFSLLFQTRIFHYQYKKADDYVAKIKNKLDALPVLLDQDSNFFYLLYKQKELNFYKLEKEFKNENIFISKSDNNLIKVAIPRV